MAPRRRQQPPGAIAVPAELSAVLRHRPCRCRVRASSNNVDGVRHGEEKQQEEVSEEGEKLLRQVIRLIKWTAPSYHNQTTYRY